MYGSRMLRCPVKYVACAFRFPFLCGFERFIIRGSVGTKVSQGTFPSFWLWIGVFFALVAFLMLIGKDFQVGKIGEELITSTERNRIDEEFIFEEQILIIGNNKLAMNVAKIEKNSLREFDLNWDLQRHTVWGNINTSRTDLIRLREGNVYGQMWFVGSNCTESPLDAVQNVFEQIDTIKRLIERHGQDLSLATTVAELEAAIAQEKIGSLVAVKGGHSINSKLGLLRTLYALGVRCMSLASEQNCCSWVDSAIVDSLDIDAAGMRGDLSIWGRLVVWEMNRLGMIVDLSYGSYGVALDVLRYSRAPVIFSNAGAYAINRHHFNVKEDVLIPLATQGGLIMISFDPKILGGYTIDNVLEHLNYLREVIGPDHIGIGSGFEGFDGAIDGLEDVSKFPNLFAALAQGKYSDGETFPAWSKDELQKLAGLNFLRVFHEVERAKEQLSHEQPFEDEGSDDMLD